jgi:hypothetical protein
MGRRKSRERQEDLWVVYGALLSGENLTQLS